MTTWTQVSCPRGCGMVSRPGPIKTHARSCLTPLTLDRIYEIGRVDTSISGCWEWQGIDGGKADWYPRIGQRKVMQFVCHLAYGDPIPGLDVPLHACDNKRCVRADHLRWGSVSDNVRDAYDRHRGIGHSRHMYLDRSRA